MKSLYWHQMTQGTKRSLRASARLLDTANSFGIEGSSGDGGTVF
ncbi:hypothetical protein Cp1R7AA1_085 [Mesorhizobium phage Cp1R7A-A1]|nr:hypothetical protein Cp1R7AA1_085 [Mesorhizobium phage Cp1R7A-A1]